MLFHEPALGAEAPAGGLLPGESGDVDLGRPLVEPARFPTIRELRQSVRRPEIRPVLVFKLFSSGDNHHLPAWSEDGQRLALQQSDLSGESSRLLVFGSLAEARPARLTDRPRAYDYMFRWAVNAPASYSFVRIESAIAGSRVEVSLDGRRPECRTPEPGRRDGPALCRRTDGAWCLVYSEKGDLVRRVWSDSGLAEKPQTLTRGSAPRWSRDGQRLLLVRERPGGNTPACDVVVRNLATETEVLLAHGEEGMVRSPTWSPDERYAAFYVRRPGESPSWRIRVAPADAHGPATTLADNVVVNLDFASEGPSWEPSSRRVWFFSHEHRAQAYYPMVAAEVPSGKLTLVDYPARCTTPNDLAVHPRSVVPEIALVAHDGLPQDLLIVLCNHY